jgi:Ca-activated chloride channel family protein
MRTLLFALAATATALVAASGASPAAAEEVEPGPGPAGPDHARLTYLARDGSRAELPIVSSQVAAVIRGPIAQLTLTQVYANTEGAPIDAVYVFPLPDTAAVGAMTLASGDRRVRAVIKRRDEARDTYDRAKRAGKLAALLDQERPNVFTQSVANLAPGEQVGVELQYDVLLAPDGGVYELALPTVVGPRYIPGGGGAVDTARVPDASRITPPVATGTGNTVSVTIDLDAGLPIKSVTSRTHALDVTKRGASARTIALAAGATAADKDVVIAWNVDVTQPTVAALAEYGGTGGDAIGHLALVVQPPALPPTKASEIGPRELVFVVDTSGSMGGRPLEIAQAAMRRALAQLRATDRFRILNFSSSVGGLDDGASLVATADNVARGIEFVNDLRSAGGTEMVSGIRAALSRPDPDVPTFVCFMTDGFIGNEREVLGAIEQGLDPRTRLFSVGIGSSVNRFLLDRMAKVGHGAADYVLLADDDADAVIDRFLARLDAPVLGALEVDWGGLDVIDQTPSALPDLFAGQPIVVVARYKRGGRGEVTIRGSRNGKALTYEQALVLPSAPTASDVLGRLWARRHIEEVDRRKDLEGERAEHVDEITATALAYHLMSAHTSFVAVEERTTRDVAGKVVTVPVELPAGVPADAVGDGELEGVDEVQAYRTNAPVSLEYGGGGEDDEGEGGEVADVYVTAGVLAEATNGRWRGSFDAGLSLSITAPAETAAGETPARAGITVSGSIQHRLAGRLRGGLEAALLGRFGRDDVATLSAVLARWAVRFLDLQLGLGAALRFDGEVGVAWHARAGVPLPMGGALRPELSLRVGQARIDGEDDDVTIGVGLGVAF